MNVQEIASSATLFCTLLAFCLLICFFNGGKSLGKGGNDDLKDRKTAAACRIFSFFTYFCSLILRPAQSIYKFTMYTIMETTLVLLKPSCVQRNLIGEIVSRFERRGLQIVGMKMMQLSDQILREHYAHLTSKPFFPALAGSMQTSPVVALALRGVDAVQVVRTMTGATNAREAAPGTIRGDYSMSNQQNIVHASDSIENATIELARFFRQEEVFDFTAAQRSFVYGDDEMK